MRLSVRRALLAAGFALALVLVVQLGQQAMWPEQEDLMMGGTDHVEYLYGKAMPLIFVGSEPWSGTTLTHVMLDAHPEVHCGEETRIIPHVLAMPRPGPNPFTLKSSVYLLGLFPNSKSLLMVRDGRASVHSMITRKVTIAGFDLSSYRDCLTKGNKAIERCLKLILDFLGITWSDAVLHHEDLIGKPGSVSLSKIERSTDQVIKPMNLEALSKWTGHIPGDVLRDMAQIAPMLARLVYDPYANPPNYDSPDSIVMNNTHWVLKGDDKTPAKLKGYYLQVNQNSTSSHLGSS
ncbi:hypothetical protein J1605_018312 [Eschrichtius robustus]|uniref:Protein-tyrosine sulfotransferase n=1 Tax=Eschrichtius robustus TaxID=9764 RepID=A0AB34HU60_ESCRO|nr:hypothetical protein J1605_018312 [Eschrichtius robustus]